MSNKTETTWEDVEPIKNPDVFGTSKKSVAGPQPRLNELGLNQFPYRHQFSSMVLTGTGLRKTGGLPAAGLNSSAKLDSDEFELDDFSEQEREKFSLVLRLLDDPEYVLPENPRSSSGWWVLPEILAGMPLEFRQLAVAKFEEGICVFGKVPVRKEIQQAAAAISPVAISVAGPSRPMACPEPPPEGCEFILSWRIGEFWDWNLGDFEFSWKQISDNRFQPRLLVECEKYLQCLKTQALRGDSLESSVANGILDIMAQQPSTSNTTSPTAFEIGLYSGMLLSRLVVYRAADERYAEKLLPKKSAWSDIIRHALERHGWDLSTDELIAKLNGHLSGSDKEEKGGRPLVFSGWPYLPREWGGANPHTMTFKSFSKKMADLKTKHKRRDSTRASLSKLKTRLNQVPGKQSLNDR